MTCHSAGTQNRAAGEARQWMCAASPVWTPYVGSGRTNVGDRREAEIAL